MLFYCCLISHFLLLFVFLHVCVCLSSCLLYFACTCACISFTYPVNGLCYHTLKSPKCSPEKTLLKSTSPRKTFSYRACRQCVCCVSCLSTPSSPLSSSRGMTPDMVCGENKTTCLSVLQAVAQGFCPISLEDTDQEICTGNKRSCRLIRKSVDSSSSIKRTC